MLLNSLIKKTLAITACVLVSPAIAQETPETSIETQTTPIIATAATIQAAPTMLSENGNLSGMIIAPTTSNIQGEIQNVTNARVSLVSHGKVLDIVTADETGSFSFANVQPGEYQVVGSAEGLVGSQLFQVASFTKPATITAPSTVMLQPASPQVTYDAFGSAPVAALSGSCGTCGTPAPCNTCNSCSTGFGGGGSVGGRFGGGLGSRLGGGLGSRLGGGLLSRPGIGLIGLAGLAGLDGDDASPDQ